MEHYTVRCGSDSERGHMAPSSSTAARGAPTSDYDGMGSSGKEADAVVSHSGHLVEKAHPPATRFQQDLEGYRNISRCENCFELWEECGKDWKLLLSIPPKRRSGTCGGSGNALDTTGTNEQKRRF